jgi:hypothetical protein
MNFHVEGGMRKLAFISCFLLVLVGMSSGAQALSIDGNGTWNSWTASEVNNSGNFYWDHQSWDGPTENIGYWMSNTGSFPAGTPAGPGVMPYYGNAANGTSASNIYFTNQGSVSAGMLLEIAGNAGSNTFGWYNTSNPTVLHQIFSGPNSPSSVVVFIPSSSFGFYLQGPGGTFLSQDYLSPNTDMNNQHFAVFSNTGSQTYYLGIEDLPYANSDLDFNDMVIEISAVPEPSTLLLLGSGLAGLAAFRKRSRKA